MKAAALKGAAALSKTTKLQDDAAAAPPLDPLAIQAQAEQDELPQPPAIGEMPDDLKKRMEDIEVIKNGDNIQVGGLFETVCVTRNPSFEALESETPILLVPWWAKP
jgi:hypothetical protein